MKFSFISIWRKVCIHTIFTNKFSYIHSSLLQLYFLSFQVRQKSYCSSLLLRRGGDDVGVIRVRPLETRASPPLNSTLLRPRGQTNKRVIKVTVLRIGTELQPCVFPIARDTGKYWGEALLLSYDSNMLSWRKPEVLSTFQIVEHH